MWEPNVSNDLPNRISFWIRILNLPLHFWNDQSLHTIGSEVGIVEGKDATQGRVRVSINGLKPLEMYLDVSLPSGDIKQVELKYEGLEKHCISCKSLSHEHEDCPFNRSARDNRNPQMGANQASTLERIDASKRAQDERKQTRIQASSHSYRNSHDDYHVRERDHHMRFPQRHLGFSE